MADQNNTTVDAPQTGRPGAIPVVEFRAPGIEGTADPADFTGKSTAKRGGQQRRRRSRQGGARESA